MSVRAFAPAKINLTLQVGRPRADGLHKLQSAVVFADVGDWIEAELQPDSPLHIKGPFGPDLIGAGGNLVLDAFKTITRATNVDLSAAITLEKNLPISSGMGGGSSDAAATLKALNMVWRLGLCEAALMQLGGDIGADVPVCVAARPAWMTGVGCAIAPLQVPPFCAVLINPGKPLSTAAVFRAFDSMDLGGDFAETSAPVWRTPEDVWEGVARLGNDLEAPARALMPEIEDIAARLRADKRVRCVGLSGSGATMFALAETSESAQSLAADVARARPGWWVSATRLGAP